LGQQALSKGTLFGERVGCGRQHAAGATWEWARWAIRTKGCTGRGGLVQVRCGCVGAPANRGTRHGWLQLWACPGVDSVAPKGGPEQRGICWWAMTIGQRWASWHRWESRQQHQRREQGRVRVVGKLGEEGALTRRRGEREREETTGGLR
jgi:hypothetical protein